VYGITVFGDAVNSGEVIARWFMGGIMTPFCHLFQVLCHERWPRQARVQVLGTITHSILFRCRYFWDL